MKKFSEYAGVAICVAVVGLSVAYITPPGRAAINTYVFGVQKADDATNYQTRKEVEDTCRSMVASYEADVLVYEQYRNSEEEEKQGWAEQAKMRANKTVSTYNHYILKNSFVWEDNVPADILTNLETIQ